MKKTRQDLRTNFTTRQYMLSKDFEVYYYSDLNMQQVEAHAHDYYEFYLFVGGKASLKVNHTTERLSAGDLIVIPPHTRHQLTVLSKEEPYQRFIFWISQDFCNSLMELSKDYGFLPQYTATNHRYIYHLDVLSMNDIRAKLIALLEELHSNRFGKSAKVYLCVNDFILTLNRTIYEMVHPEIEQEEKSLYQSILRYIEDNLTEQLSLESIANEFYVSKYHIAHIFKEQLGISVHQYIIKKRLDLSRSAILSGDDISSSYLQCGFHDYSSFFRSFKKEYGLSPKEFQTRERNRHIMR